MFGIVKKNFARSWVIVACLIMVFTVLTVVPANVSAKDYQLKFNPGAQREFVQTLKTTRVRDMGDSKQTEVEESKIRVQIKQTATGYEMVTTPISIRNFINGQEVSNPMKPVLMELNITYVLDKDGGLINIRGYENLDNIIRDNLPFEAYNSVSEFMTREKLETADMLEWFNRYGVYLGQQAKTGEIWTQFDTVEVVKDINIQYYTAIKFGQEKTVGGRKLLQVDYQFHTDPASLKDFFGKSVNDVYKEFGLTQKIEFAGVEIKGSGQRLIDPQTMLVYSETMKRNVFIDINTSIKERVKSVVEETKEYTYEYLK